MVNEPLGGDPSTGQGLAAAPAVVAPGAPTPDIDDVGSLDPVTIDRFFSGSGGTLATQGSLPPAVVS